MPPVVRFGGTGDVVFPQPGDEVEAQQESVSGSPQTVSGSPEQLIPRCSTPSCNREINRTTSWNFKDHIMEAAVDPSAGMKVDHIDYSPSDYNRSTNTVFSAADSLVNTQRPVWASVRWTNLDVELHSKRHVSILKHVLKKQLDGNTSAAGLALESIIAEGQRARMQFFDGVLFLLSKVSTETAAPEFSKTSLSFVSFSPSTETLT